MWSDLLLSLIFELDFFQYSFSHINFQPVLPPAHGSFFVMRLAKCGKCLGIVCQSHQNGTTKGEPLIISHIRIGSVAHR